MVDPKIFENRVRRAAKRQGLRVVKSRRRDPRATDYETYTIFDQQNNPIGGGHSLAQVADYLELNDLLDKHATTARTDFSALIDKWDLVTVSNELDDLLKGLRDPDHPKTAMDFGHSLVAFLAEFR